MSRARTLTRREFLALAGAGAIGASLLGAGCDLSRRLPNLPGRPPASDTNVVLVIIDSLRKDHVGAYGNTWIETPNLDTPIWRYWLNQSEEFQVVFDSQGIVKEVGALPLSRPKILME